MSADPVLPIPAAATQNDGLPADWDVATLGEIASVFSGGTPSRARPSYWGPPIPWVTTTEVNAGEIRSTKEQITEAGLAHSAARIAPPGTLLIAMYGQGKTRGKTAILGIPAAINQACAAVAIRDVSPRFVFHYLVANYESIRALSNSGNQENLSGGIVKKISVPVPPDAEQVQIATVLDEVDDLIAQLVRLIAKKAAIKQGLMQQLLTGQTRLPGYTVPWAEIVLGDVVSYVKNIALSRAQMDDTSALRYLHYGDIHTSPRVTLDAAHEPMPRASAPLVGTAGRLKVGDLVFVDASEDPAGVGKSVEVTSVPAAGVVPGLHTIAARFDKTALADGFKAYVQFIPAFRAALLRLAAGTKVLATTRSHVSSIALRLPAPDEQRAIARVLTDTDVEIDALREQLRKARAIKQGMMQQLLTGRTRLAPAEAIA